MGGQSTEEYNTSPSKVYIYLDKKNWLKNKNSLNEIDCSQAFRDAKQQFDRSFSWGKKVGNMKVKDVEKHILGILSKVPKMEDSVEQFYQEFQGLIKGDTALHMQDVEGLGMNLNSFAYGAKKNPAKYKKKMMELLKSSQKKLELKAGLETLINPIKEIGKDLKRNEKTGKMIILPGVEIDPIASNPSITNLYQDLNTVVKDITKMDATPENAEKLMSLLKSQGFNFSNNFSGAVDEVFKVAYIGAQFLADEKILKQFEKKLGLPNVNVEVIQRGNDTYEADSGNLSVRAKGDIEIKITWGFGMTKGSWSYLISEKSSEIATQSKDSKKKNWRGRFVKGARYDVIFDKVTKTDIETLFCNMYVHERAKVLNKKNPIMSYIGARCAANILAGPAGEFMAHAVREGDGTPVPISELLDKMGQEMNKGEADRYINTWLSSAPKITDENKKVYISGATSEENKWARSNKVYSAIRGGVRFSATLGSRTGLDGLI